MTCDEEKPRRKGPSNFTLSIGGILSIAGLLTSGVATYNSIQNDIATLKRGELYQERTNERLGEEIRTVRTEQRETMREFNEKLDRIIENWPQRRR
jgi:hypothetical protein